MNWFDIIGVRYYSNGVCGLSVSYDDRRWNIMHICGNNNNNLLITLLGPEVSAFNTEACNKLMTLFCCIRAAPMLFV